MVKARGRAPSCWGGQPGKMRDIVRWGEFLHAIGTNDQVISNCPFATHLTAPLEPGTTFSREPNRFTDNNQIVDKIKPTPAGVFAWTRSTTSSLRVAHHPQGGPQPCMQSQSTVARFDGEDWRIAGGLNGVLETVLIIDGVPTAFGQFTSAGGQPVGPGVAGWFSDRWGPHLEGLNSNVRSAVMHEGIPHALSSTSTTSTVFRWTGSAWEQVGGAFSLGPGRIVSAGGELFVYRTNSSTVFRFSGGAWAALPTAPGNVIAAEDAGGQLTIATSSSVFRLVSGAWEALPAFPATVSLRTLAWHNGTLHAGLNWGGSPLSLTSPIMYFDGSQWVKSILIHPPRVGAPHPYVSIYDLVSDGNILHAVGQFTYISGVTAESWAMFYSGPPRLLTHPAATTVDADSAAYFSIDPEVYHDPSQTYSWRKDGATLVDGPTPGGSVISGATTPYLRITGANETDQGEYSVRVTNGCGQMTSSAAPLVVVTSAPCPADFNQDGGVDLADVEAFYMAWEACDSAADVNADGGVDGSDVETFFIAWEAGGCD